MGGNASDAECAAIPRGPACKLVAELTFGVDFVAKASGNNIAIVPLKPFKAKTAYVIALTDAIQDSEGMAVSGSISYDLVKQDINENPLKNRKPIIATNLNQQF